MSQRVFRRRRPIEREIIYADQTSVTANTNTTLGSVTVGRGSTLMATRVALHTETSGPCTFGLFVERKGATGTRAANASADLESMDCIGFWILDVDREINEMLKSRRKLNEGDVIILYCFNTGAGTAVTSAIVKIFLAE